MITIAPYCNSWPTAFEAEAWALQSALGSDALRIEHVGSTSVPGLDAKPVIDIQVSVRSLDLIARYCQVLSQLDYRFISVGDFDLIYPFFSKPSVSPSTHHVHLCLAGGHQELKHIAFRNHLRASPQDAAEYVNLKRRLAAKHRGDTLASREAYSLSKSEFVRRVLETSGIPWSDHQ